MKKFSNMTNVMEKILILEYIYVNLPFYKCIFLYLGNHLCSKKRYMMFLLCEIIRTGSAYIYYELTTLESKLQNKFVKGKR